MTSSSRKTLRNPVVVCIVDTFKVHKIEKIEKLVLVTQPQQSSTHVKLCCIHSPAPPPPAPMHSSKTNFRYHVASSVSTTFISKIFVSSPSHI